MKKRRIGNVDCAIIESYVPLENVIDALPVHKYANVFYDLNDVEKRLTLYMSRLDNDVLYPDVGFLEGAWEEEGGIEDKVKKILSIRRCELVIPRSYFPIVERVYCFETMTGPVRCDDVSTSFEWLRWTVTLQTREEHENEGKTSEHAESLVGSEDSDD